MIEVIRRDLIIPREEFNIGTNYDANSEVRHFRVKRIPGGIDLSQLTFNLDMEYANGKADSVSLVKDVSDKWIDLTLTVFNSMLQVPGSVQIQLRALNMDGEVKWTSYKSAFYVEDSIDTPASYINQITEVENIKTSENERAEAEKARVAAEQARVEAENARVAAEQARESVKDSRDHAEAARNEAEAARKKAEAARAEAEMVRVSAENERKKAESARVDAEKSRVAAEEARVKAEQDRENQTVDASPLYVTENGTYDPGAGKYYNRVRVNVSGGGSSGGGDGGGDATLKSKIFTANGTYYAFEDGADGYDVVTVNVDGGALALHTVTFTDDDGASLESQMVRDGASAVYTGTPLTKPYYWQCGWSPSPVNVHQNLVCKPVWQTKFNSEGEIKDSWAEIVKNGGAKYPVGSFKLLEFVEGSGCAPVFMEKVYEGEAGTTSTWVSKNIIVNKRMCATNDTDGGWRKSELRSWMNKDLASVLPAELRDGVKPATKYSYAYDKQNSRYYTDDPTNDLLWVPSHMEIFGTSGCETLCPVYTMSSRVKTFLVSGSSGIWGERSVDHSTNFRYVYSNGSEYSDSASYSGGGVVLGFCL
jgi:hypothetical protein